MTSGNGRFAEHAFLKFVLLSIKNRETALSNTSFGILQMPNESAMNKDELLELFALNNKSVEKMSRQISAFTNKIPGSSPYWWQQKKNVDAMIEHKLNVRNELPLTFSTGSMVEYHWLPLHKLLRDALLLWGHQSEVFVLQQKIDNNDNK